MNNTIPLPVLQEDNPRDFLAALGLLRLFALRWPEATPRLSWSDAGVFSISTSVPVTNDWGREILNLLLSWREHTPNPFGHGKIESIAPEQFRNILQKGSDLPRFDPNFYTSLASQLSHDKTGRRSELIIESASRSVLSGIDKLLSAKKKPDLAADFTGSSEPKEVSNTSRWHPAEYQSAAYVATDPQHNKHRDWVGLNIVALVGLGFYPCVDTARGRKTPGVRRLERTTEFSWPIWSHPLTPLELASLLHHPAVHEEPADPSILRPMGVCRVWRSRKFKPDGNNDYFSSAKCAF